MNRQTCRRSHCDECGSHPFSSRYTDAGWGTYCFVGHYMHPGLFFHAQGIAGYVTNSVDNITTPLQEVA